MPNISYFANKNNKKIKYIALYLLDFFRCVMFGIVYLLDFKKMLMFLFVLSLLLLMLLLLLRLNFVFLCL